MAEVTHHQGSAGTDRMQRLARLADVLSDAVTVDEVVTAVVAAGTDTLMADSVSVCLLDEEAGVYLLAGQGGLRPDMAASWSSFPSDAPVPVVDAVRDRELVVIEGIADRERRYPVFGTGPISSNTIAVAPMVVHDRTTIGAISVGFTDVRVLDEVDRAFLAAAGALCGQAVHRARLFEYQQRTVARQRFLLDAGQLLAAEVDHERTLDQLARLAVQEVADVCAVCLSDDDGVLVPAVAVHRLAEGQSVVDALVERQPVIRNEALLEVARTGRAMFVPIVERDGADGEAAGEGDAEDEAHLQLVRALDVTSAMVVPLRARGQAFGLVLLMMTSASGRRFAEDDRQLADELAVRAALAIDNARLLTERSELVEHLQVALSSHRAIEQAKGVLATRLGITTSEAFDRMRRHARSSRQKLEQVAEAVVEGCDELQA
jgi:GAF domain-containing protein